MTIRGVKPDEAMQFLDRLRHELRYARKADREDYIAQIEEHLRESREELDSSSPEGLSELLARLGSPEELAREFYVAERVKLNAAQRFLLRARRWWIGALLTVPILSIVVLAAWANAYQPLSPHLGGGYQDVVTALSGKAPVMLSEGDAQPVTWRLTHGRYRLEIVFAAENLNSLPVTISPPPLVPGWPNAVSWHLQSNSSLKQSPFRSAQVPGQGYREIVFSTTYTCVPWPKGNPNSTSHETDYITQLPIMMSFAGFTHTIQLAVQPFYLTFAGDCFDIVSPQVTAPSVK